MTVDAAFLEGDPVGAHIPFFDHVHPDRAGLGDANSRAMQRPAVAEQNEVANRPVDKQTVKELRPFMLAAVEVDRTRKSPECLIAAVKIDSVHGVSARRERPPKAFKKSRRHPLQKEKGAIC
jgi:hypothetical protein